MPKTLSKRTIDQVFERHTGAMSTCIARMTTLPGDGVGVSVAFTIQGSSGRVSSARVVGAADGSGDVERCLERTVRRMLFPRFQEAELVLNRRVAPR